jgi:hypothetical protein
VLRFLAAALACAASVYGSETEESVRKSVPVSAATHLRLNAEFGSINVQPGTSRSGTAKDVDVEVHFRGDPRTRREFDQMLRDFSLKVEQQGSEVSVNATFIHGWEPLVSFIFDNLFYSPHPICHNWRCLVYSSWLEEVEFRITVPRQFDANVATSGGSIFVGTLKGEVIAHTSGGWLRFDRIEGPINGSTSGGGITLTGNRGRAVIHTSGGPIRISDSDGDVDAYTSGGPIQIDGVSGRVKAHTSGGSIDAQGITGAIDASTSGGWVTASLRGQPQQECRIYTAGGSINVSLAGDARVNLDASTSGGVVSTDFLVPYTGDRHQTELRAPINGGGPLFYLHTSGGWINVRRAG